MARTRFLRIINGDRDRADVIDWVNRCKDGSRVEGRGPARTLPQNDRMWAMLTDIVKQRKTVDGREFSTTEWKSMFLEQLAFETEREHLKQNYVPSLDGRRFVAVGDSTSKLGKEEFSDLIESIYAWGAENGVEWSDPTLDSYISMMRQ
jgi:hypothetical protein